MGKFIDLTGRKFGKLTVIKRSENKGEKVTWMCECECGNHKEVMSCSLLKGVTTSCGCLHREKMRGNKNSAKHGQRHTKLYNVWLSMKQRCSNPKTQYYYLYGGKGISVCEEWSSDFESFYKWSVENGYKDGLTIERIDGNGNYEPSNCKWATYKEQANNTSRNHYLVYNGKRQTISQWSNETGISERCLLHRLERGWSVERTLTEH